MVDGLAEGRQREEHGSKHGDEQREEQQIGQVRGDEGRGKGITRADHSGGQGRGTDMARWIADEGWKKNRTQMLEKVDVGGQDSTDGGGSEIRSQNEDSTAAELLQGGTK